MQIIPAKKGGSGTDNCQKTLSSPPHAMRFTLIELLAAVALAIIIAAAAMTAFTQTAGVGSLANARIDAMHNARAALDIIESDLRSAWIDSDGRIFWGVNPDYENPEEDFEGEDNPADGPIAITFDVLKQNGDYAFLEIQTLSGRGGVRGPARVNYYWWVGEDDELSRAVLLRAAEPAHTEEAPVAENESGNIVAFNVTGMKMRYFYDSKDYETWDSIDVTDDASYRRMPRAVEITMETVDDKGVLLREENEPVRIRRIIEPGGTAR